jgi:hypothetical protein
MGVTMKNAIFWDVTLYGSYTNRLETLPVANIVPSSPILVTLMMEVLCSSKSQFL